MVNHGRSKGCNTCKQRRVKCDEGKPSCRNCQRLGLECGGYEKINPKLRFKSQNHSFRPATRPSPRGRLDKQIVSQRRQTQAQPRILLELAPDTSVPFYLSHYSIFGRGLESTRGFFENLTPMFCAEPYDSPFTKAITTVATVFESLWKRGPVAILETSPQLIQTLHRLHTAMESPQERHRPSTVLAILVLQHFENISAAFGSRGTSRTHHNGALALLSSVSAEPNRTVSDEKLGYLMRYALHTEVSAALRQGTSIPDDVRSWLGNPLMMSVPSNPSSSLDILGVLVSDARSGYMDLTRRGRFPPRSETDLSFWRDKIHDLNSRLLSWANNVPAHWRPLRLASAWDMKASVVTYLSGCDVYPSCQIASIWNLWRTYRLLTLQVQVALFRALPEPRGAYATCQAAVQNIVDGLCYSVPFYLGDRTRPCSITDFDRSEISLPSYHGLPPDKVGDRDLVVADEHYRHTVAQGPWHIMGPLSRVLTLFNEKDGDALADMLRPGQRDWIRQQFLRAVAILHLPTGDGDGGTESVPLSTKALMGAVDLTGADRIATNIRKRLALSGGS